MKRQAVNPYLPGWEYIPDGEPRLFDGRLYVFGSHDEARGESYCTGDYVCWSAPEEDLASWSFEGVIYRKTDDPDYPEGKELLFAPDVVRGADGRYYLYYFSTKMEKIGVAVCDTPAGHYRFYGNVHFPDGRVLSQGMGYGQPFDPAVLAEKEGVWLYYGIALQNHKEGIPEEAYEGGFVAGLEQDMLTIRQEPVRTIPGKQKAAGTGYEDHAFLEASSIRRYGDLYYLGNNHGSLVEVGNQLYIFYHRHTHGIQYSRQGCAEPVKIGADGRISQVEITSCGLNGGPLLARGEYSAHIACYLRSAAGILHYSSHVHWNEEHPYIAQENEGGAATLQNQYIYNLRDGAECGFKYFLFDGTEKEIRLRVRGDFTGQIDVIPDEPNGKVSASLNVEKSEKWSWTGTEIAIPGGVHALYFKVSGQGSCDLDAFAIS